MNSNLANTIIRAFCRGEGNQGFSAIPLYYQGDNQFNPNFSTALIFQNHQQARQAIAEITSDRVLYLEIIEVYPNYL